MKYKMFTAIALFFALGLIIAQVHAAGQYRLMSSVFGSAGGEMSNGSYQVAQTAGQPLIGQVSSSSYQADIGFWYTVPSPANEILAIYVVAFDNPLTSTHNLTPYFPKTLAGIVESTANASDKKAVVLADLDGVGDTQILLVENGVATAIPITDVLPTVPHNEYDMTDGATLGAFLTWALDEHADAQTKTLFSYLGHGSFVAPETNVAEIFNSPSDAIRSISAGNGLFPVPAVFEVHPELTDEHAIYDGITETFSPSLLSPYDLALALESGTNGGQNPIDLLDLVHCFAASIEQFYELSPYTGAMTGSPNYAYYAPEMSGRVLAAVEPMDSSQTLAGKVIAKYEEVIAEHDEVPSQHPRIMVAVESSKIASIVEGWDQTATFLLTEFDQDYQQTRDRISNAYTASAKSDTTFCQPQDFALAAPDALSDMADFATKLRDEFGATSDVGSWAETTRQRIEDAVLAKLATNGQPWFAESEPPPDWSFDESAGIALYTDFQGMSLARDPDSIYLSWQARWYTSDAFTDPSGLGNPHPYRFAQDTEWDEVFHRFWQNEFANGQLQTAACMPDLPPASQDGELSIDDIIAPLTVTVGSSLSFAAVVKSDMPAHNPLVEFTLSQNGSQQFTNTVGSGYLVTGTHTITASREWIATEHGPFTLEVFVDADDRVNESNENDNIATITGTIYQVGDCNVDGTVNAADLSAIIREIFNPGTFGLPCDANEDASINAADISCIVQLIFNGPAACGNNRSSTVASVASQNGAILSLPTEMPAPVANRITLPITFTANSHQISSLVASVDYDQNRLSLDPTDSDGDGIPDAITFNQPNSFNAQAFFDSADSDGEIDLVIMDISLPLDSLPDGNVAFITLQVINPTSPLDGAVRFSTHPAPSLGHNSGQNIPVQLEPPLLSQQLFLPMLLR